MNKEIKERIESSWHHLQDALEEIRNIGEEIEEVDPDCSCKIDQICGFIEEEAEELYQLCEDE